MGPGEGPNSREDMTGRGEVKEGFGSARTGRIYIKTTCGCS